jgi:hypothetical protein
MPLLSYWYSLVNIVSIGLPVLSHVPFSNIQLQAASIILMLCMVSLQNLYVLVVFLNIIFIS